MAHPYIIKPFYARPRKGGYILRAFMFVRKIKIKNYLIPAFVFAGQHNFTISVFFFFLKPNQADTIISRAYIYIYIYISNKIVTFIK
jgi:hypothetical protein